MIFIPNSTYLTNGVVEEQKKDKWTHYFHFTKLKNPQKYLWHCTLHNYAYKCKRKITLSPLAQFRTTLDFFVIGQTHHSAIMASKIEPTLKKCSNHAVGNIFSASLSVPGIIRMSQKITDGD